jgi:PHD-finger
MLDPSMQLEAGTSSAPQPILLESDSGTVVVDDEVTISRSNSSLNLQDSAPSALGGRSKRKDKGKAKEVDTPPLRVKEEPKPFSLHTPEPPNNLVSPRTTFTSARLTNWQLNNEDHCSSCRSYGALVYCDGCPRAFHLWCLDPPMEGVDDGDARWFCPTCAARKVSLIYFHVSAYHSYQYQHPPRKPPPSLLSSLIHQLQVSIPVEFQLPEDIKTFFKDGSLFYLIL